MRPILLMLALATAIPASAAAQTGAQSQARKAGELKWGPAPTALPAGAEAAVVSGDPAKAGPLVLRLKFPAGYAVPPHSHPAAETVTVVSGTLRMGMGDKVDEASMKTVETGGSFDLARGETHYVRADSEAVVEVKTTGPWDISYANAADDPRKRR